MSEHSSFDDLIARLHGGDKDAQSELFDRFVQRLIALARKQLDSRVRQKEDPEDVVQSVFRSFFRRQADGQFDPQTENSLWQLLAHITICKCRNRVEYFQAACRDVRREVSSPPNPLGSGEARDDFARDPTPSEAAMLNERIEQLMSGLNDRGRAILALSLQGLSVPEISAKVERSERTVRAVMERVRSQLQSMLVEPE